MLSRGTLCTPTSTTSQEDVETRGLRVRRSQLSLHEIIPAGGVGPASYKSLWEAPKRRRLTEFADWWHCGKVQET